MNRPSIRPHSVHPPHDGNRDDCSLDINASGTLNITGIKNVNTKVHLAPPAAMASPCPNGPAQTKKNDIDTRCKIEITLTILCDFFLWFNSSIHVDSLSDI